MADPFILQLETALVDRLSNSSLLSIPVQPFPADPIQWRLTHPQGQVLVLYQGSKWTTDKSYVERELSFAVVVILRNLRTHAPAYAILEIIEGLLGDWYPLPDDPDLLTGPFFIAADRFVNQDDGLWYWEIDLKLLLQSALGQSVDPATLDDFLRWRDKFDVAPLNDDDIRPVVDYDFFDAEDYVDLPGPD